MPGRLRKICTHGWVLFTLLLGSSLAETAEVSASAEDLIRDFVAHFNSGDYDAMASFYEEFTSTSFQGRRDEAEDRQLHMNLVKRYGALEIQEIDTTEVSEPVLRAFSAGLDSDTEIRFILVGDPPRIDGLRLGRPGGGHGGDQSPAPVASSDGGALFDFISEDHKIYQQTLFVDTTGSLGIVWVQPGAFDLDLFIASQGADGAFTHPKRLNHKAVHPYTGDEARPAVAMGSDGSIAVVWTAGNGDMMMARGNLPGLQFDAPLKLNQDGSQAYRTMPVAAITEDGVAHAVWIDGRAAEKGMEEPAHIYYARVSNGEVKETNLTEGQTESVCGCCRPSISATRDSGLEIAFRNAPEDGFRDIFRISADAAGKFSVARSTSPGLWKIQGCPMSGPIVYDEGTLWRDASAGNWRLLWSTETDQNPASLFEGREGFDFTRPPRRVAGSDEWVLIGGTPESLIISRVDSEWRIVREGLPDWVSTAAVRDGELIQVGSVQGGFRSETTSLESD